MDLFKGITYNLKGLLLSLKTPRLLMLGIIRFVVVVILTLTLSGFIFVWHQEILNLIWTMPDSGWLQVVWKGVSLLLSLVLAGVAGLVSYVLAQILFGVFIMDYMSRITEKMVTGREAPSPHVSVFGFFLHLIRQEIPRAIIPVLLMMIFMVAGFLTPFGPVIAVLAALTASVFLAWDNTDLVPARRMQTFGDRLGYLKTHLLFHLGFGLWFMIPWVNIVFLSFAPVGATLYYVEHESL